VGQKCGPKSPVLMLFKNEILRSGHPSLRVKPVLKIEKGTKDENRQNPKGIASSFFSDFSGEPIFFNDRLKFHFYKIRSLYKSARLGLKIKDMNSNRTVYAEDALTWLNERDVLSGHSLVASMPDISEFPGWSLEKWQEWFTETAKLILSRTPDEGVCFFFQTDIKFEGSWVDKSFLCQLAAHELKIPLLFHKIVCRAPAGMATFGRPAYSHLLAFSKGVKADVAKSTPDVLVETGEKTWERGMGIQVCLTIGEFILSHTTTKTLIHPFCGEGAMLAVANELGLKAIGIERSQKRAQKAAELKVSLDENKWIRL
jgi:hypothetical protein